MYENDLAPILWELVNQFIYISLKRNGGFFGESLGVVDDDK